MLLNKIYYLRFSLFFITSFFIVTGCATRKSDEIANSANLGTATSALTPVISFDQNTLDGILVSFGDQVILLSDLQRAVATASNSQTHLLPTGQLVGGSLTSQQANQIFQDLINQKVLQVKAQELGFDIKEDELSQRIAEFLKQQGYTEADLEAQLKQDGRSMEDYRAEFKKEVLKQQLIGRVIAPLVTVTDSEVNNYYLQQTKNVKQISAVKLRSLVINLPAGAISNPESSSLVKTVQEKLATGTPFIDLVKKYSMAADAMQTQGLLSPRPVATLPPELRAQLTHLQVGQVAGPIVIGSSAFFFQYLGAEYSLSSDLKKNFANWKAKLQNTKFAERLLQYLKSEREKMNVNVRLFKIY